MKANYNERPDPTSDHERDIELSQFMSDQKKLFGDTLVKQVSQEIKWVDANQLNNDPLEIY